MRLVSQAVSVAALALAADWLAKAWAEQALTLYQPVPVVGSFARLTLGYNTGVAFSMFTGGGWWLTAFTSVLIVGLAAWGLRALIRGDIPRRTAPAVGLVLGGALGNFVDRLPDSRVTDFIDIGIGATRWPTFNTADVWIVVGVILLVLLTNGEKQDVAAPAS